jgi:hypothetical protein
MEQDDPHRPVEGEPQRMSSREMMPPPSGQIRQRSEMQFRAPTLPVERAIQHHGAYHRVLSASTSQYPSKELGRTKRSADSRAPDMSNPPIRLQPTSQTQAHHVYNRHSTHPNAHDEPMTFATSNRPLKSSFGVNQRPVVNQQISIPQRARPQPVNHTDHYVDTRDTALQQHWQRPTREPLRPVYVNDTGLQTPKRTSYPSVGPKPFLSSLRASQPTAGSVSSPFFQMDVNTSHMASRQRPPPRGGDISQTRASHGFQLGATAESQWLREPSGSSNAWDQSRLNARQEPSSDHQSFAPPPSTATLPYRGLTAASQTSGDFQPRHNSHTYASSMRIPVERQPISASRARITLPPSKSDAQGYELSSIRGLHGGYPQRVEGFPNEQQSGYTGSRPSFSAASRRSVRR